MRILKKNYSIEVFSGKKREPFPFYLFFAPHSYNISSKVMETAKIKAYSNQSAMAFLGKAIGIQDIYTKCFDIYVMEKPVDLALYGQNPLNPSHWMQDNDFIGFMRVRWFNIDLIKNNLLPPAVLFETLDDNIREGGRLQNIFTAPCLENIPLESQEFVFPYGENPAFLHDLIITSQYRDKGIARYLLNNVATFSEMFFGYSISLLFANPVPLIEKEKAEFDENGEPTWKCIKEARTNAGKFLLHEGFNPCLEDTAIWDNSFCREYDIEPKD